LTETGTGRTVRRQRSGGEGRGGRSGERRKDGREKEGERGTESPVVEASRRKERTAWRLTDGADGRSD